MQPCENMPKNVSKSTAKILPKPFQMTPWNPLRTTSAKSDANSSFSRAIWDPFWSPMDSLGAPKITENGKSMQKNRLKIDT